MKWWSKGCPHVLEKAIYCLQARWVYGDSIIAVCMCWPSTKEAMMILWVEKNDLFRSSFCFHSHLNVRALGLGIVYKQYNNSRTQKPTFIMPDKIQRLDGTVICCWFMSLYEKFKRSLLSTGTELTNGIVTHTFECSYTRLSIHHYNTEISITTSYHFRNGPVLELLRAPNSLNPRQQSDRISSVLRVPNLKKSNKTETCIPSVQCYSFGFCYQYPASKTVLLTPELIHHQPMPTRLRSPKWFGE